MSVNHVYTVIIPVEVAETKNARYEYTARLMN